MFIIFLNHLNTNKDTSLKELRWVFVIYKKEYQKTKNNYSWCNL